MLEAILISSLTGSVLTVFLLLFKNRLLAHFGGKALYRISLLTMLLFVLPLHFSSLQPPHRTVRTAPEMNVTATPSAMPAVTTDTPQVIGAAAPNIEATRAIPTSTKHIGRSVPLTTAEVLTVLWLSGAAILLSRHFIAYRRFERKMRGCPVCETIGRMKVIQTPLVVSPMQFGFFRPTLAMPNIEMSAEEYALVLKHEMVHYHRHDAWLKLFAVVVNAVCWFNPLSYCLLNLVGEACEYACDEQVTLGMSDEDKKQYSYMILNMICQSSPALSSNMAKSKNQLKRRFEMIMNKKQRTAFKTLLCMVMILLLGCGSVVFANEVVPYVSTLLKHDYVYVGSHDGKGYSRTVPVEKDGVLYLPLREFLNKSDVPNDKIVYDLSDDTIRITVNFRTKPNKVVYTLSPNDADGETERASITIPARRAWSTSCCPGSTEVTIDGEVYTLENAPYKQDGITYVPYEYVKLLKRYEEGWRNSQKMVDGQWMHTSVFTSMVQYGYNSMESEYFCDEVQVSSFDCADKLIGGEDFTCYACLDAAVSLKKTGYRTEFNAQLELFDANNPTQESCSAEITLNKVTRIYSKGNDIEGLFTVKLNGETVYENKKGVICGLPQPAGEGIIDFNETIIDLDDICISTWFFGFGEDATDDYSALSQQNRLIAAEAETQQLGLFPSEVKLGDIQVTHTAKNNYFTFNTAKDYGEIDITFDNGASDRYVSYRITLNENSNIHVIDENTFSAHFFLERTRTRIDSFDGVITLLPDNRFELKSADGNYIIRGKTNTFVPQWQWSEEQKNEPPALVNMIEE